MRRSLSLNSHPFFVQIGLSIFFGLAISSTHANSNHTPTYSDAVFAANAVKAPAAEDDNDGDGYYSYRRRYDEISEARQQAQRAAEEQKSHDAQFSSIPRANESDAEYQARMEKEQNPVWLKHQAQAKLRAQIEAQNEAKLKEKSLGIAPALPNAVSVKSLPTDGLSATELTVNQVAEGNDLNALSFSQPTSEPSHDSISEAMSISEKTGYSLFFWLGIVCCMIYLVRFLRRPPE